jgi:uncharacterized membrane protein YkvA (DUF1232 family)
MERKRLEQELVKAGAQKVSEQDIAEVVDKSAEIQGKFATGGPLQRFVDDGRLLLSVVKDYWSGRYRQLPMGTVGAAVFTLIYVLNPLDLVPDVLPVIGQIDDAAVVAACLLLIEHDLRKYTAWQKGRAEGRPE